MLSDRMTGGSSSTQWICYPFWLPMFVSVNVNNVQMFDLTSGPAFVLFDTFCIFISHVRHEQRGQERKMSTIVRFDRHQPSAALPT